MGEEGEKMRAQERQRNQRAQEEADKMLELAEKERGAERAMEEALTREDEEGNEKIIGGDSC